MDNRIADLHCHPALKPTYNEEIDNLWVEYKNPRIGKLLKGIRNIFRRMGINKFLKTTAVYTQSHLEACYKGNVKLLYFAIYPPERPFMKPARPFDRGTTKSSQRKKLRWIFNEIKTDSKIIRALTGFSGASTKKFLDDIYVNPQVDYFNDFMSEYQKIKSEHNKPFTIKGYKNKVKLKLVNDYSEIEKLAYTEIGGILTIEGMHAIAKYNKDHLFGTKNIDELDEASKKALKNSFIKNIENIKKLEFPPFFITFSHHFNNLISGHAKSFKGPKNDRLPGFSQVFDQRHGLEKGFTKIGLELIKDYLLSKQFHKRRILIDTKHMSLKCRDQYMEIVKNYPDTIPIICSHTAINGIIDRKEAGRRTDTNKLDHRSYVSRWDINITNEDITDIFDTDGIIGICMHDGRMPGGKFTKLVNREKKQGNDIRIQRLHTQMFLTNIFHVVRVNLEHIRKLSKNESKILEKEAWRTVCLGTDFDGIIDPFDHFNTSETLSLFKGRCKEAIEKNFSSNEERKRARVRYVGQNDSRPFTKSEFEDLLIGYTPQEIVDMVFYNNIDAFNKKYYNSKYLGEVNFG